MKIVSKIFATCGHEIHHIPQRPIAVKNVIQNGVHAISWQTLCKNCIAKYRELGLILETEKQEREWLQSGETKKPERYG